MLGKQWLNRYASTDMRGTAIERSQNRQRKLDGIVVWYFDYVMESLPLMLQAALLLLGCALSRYLWEVNITVASIIIGFTSFGMIFYIFILTAGSTSESCPYQTPGSRALCYLGPRAKKVLNSTTSVIRECFRKSKIKDAIASNVQYHHPWSRGRIIPFMRDMILELPLALAIDAAGCTVASWLCPLSLPLGGEYHCCIHCHWFHFVWDGLLPVHHHCWLIF